MENKLPVTQCQYCGSRDIGEVWQHGEALVTFRKRGLSGNHPLSEMERVPAEELPKRLDELFDRMDKENVGFVVTEEGKDSCVFCPYKWFELEYETIEVAVDEVLLAQIKEIITPLGWTVERLIVRFLEWLVDPETQEEAIAWLMKAKEELGEK